MNPLARPTQPALPPWLALSTLALAVAAPLLTFLSRSGQAPPGSYLIFDRLFLFNDHLESLAMLAGLGLAAAWSPARDAASRVAEWMGEHPSATCAGAFVALAAGARFVYMAHPLSMDEYSPWMQAHAFVQGQLAAHYPAPLLDEIVPPWFQGNFIIVDSESGTAMSAYWPGLALLMAPFAFVHLSWCLNPALSVLALALIGELAAQSGGGRGAAGWAMLAALASPQFSVNAMSFYAMPGLLALNLLFLWLLLREGWRSAFAAGLVGGLALVMINPVPHALMALPCIIWLASDRLRWPRLGALAAGYLPFALLIGLGWPLLTASLSMTHGVARPPYPGFVAEWTNRLHGIFRLPSRELIEARWFAAWKVWIWASPGLLFLPFVRAGRDPTQRLLLAALCVTFAFYFLVRFDQGHGWGYRYIHPVWGVLPIAGGVWIANAGPAGRRFGAIMLAAGILATPVFLWQTRATIASALSQRLEPPAEGHWVVFVAQQPLHYSGDLVQNAPGRSRVLFLVSRGDEADRVLMAAQFPQAVQKALDRRGSMWLLPGPVRSATSSAGTN